MEPNFEPMQSQPGPLQGKTTMLNLDYNIAGLLCYVPFVGLILSIIFITAKPKEHRFVLFHAYQSLIFGGSILVLSVVLAILATIIGFIPVIGLIFGILMIPVFLIISLGSFALMVLNIVKAYQNEMWHIPVIGNKVDTMI